MMTKFPSLRGQGMIAFDCETCDPDMKDKGSGAHRGSFICGVAVGTEKGFREYYPVAHEAGGNLPKDKVFRWLKEQLKLPVPKVGAHLLYDLGFLHEVGVEPAGPFYDVQVAEPLLCETRYNYGLEALSKDYLGAGKVDDEMDAFLKEKFGKKNPKGNIWRAPPEVVRPYAIGDVNHPLEIFAKQKVELEKQGLWDLFVMESKLIPMLHAMRRRGVRVDLRGTQKMLEEFRREQKSIHDQLVDLAGGDFSIWAAEEIAPVLDRLGIEYPLTPKTRKPSLTAGFLEGLDHPFADMLVEERRIDKMCGTFLEGSILESHHEGRIHCQFNQLKGEEGGAVSGRFSSSKPNLQFIPIRTEAGKKIRQKFLPDPGHIWWKFDYSQIEFRLVVHDAAHSDLPGGREIAERFARDPTTDFHAIVAELAGIDRSRAKTINFGLIYGEGIDKLCRQLGLERSEGEKFLSEYHRKVPFIKNLSQGCMNLANRTGVVETLYGRKRRFDLWAKDDWKTGKSIVLPHRFPGARRAWTYRALNARTQGGAADIMKDAMVKTWESGAYDVLGPPLLTVHDELDGSSPAGKKTDEALREVKHIMENVVKLRLPLKVDGSRGKNWGDAK